MWIVHIRINRDPPVHFASGPRFFGFFLDFELCVILALYRENKFWRVFFESYKIKTHVWNSHIIVAFSQWYHRAFHLFQQGASHLCLMVPYSGVSKHVGQTHLSKDAYTTTGCLILAWDSFQRGVSKKTNKQTKKTDSPLLRTELQRTWL